MRWGIVALLLIVAPPAWAQSLPDPAPTAQMDIQLSADDVQTIKDAIVKRAGEEGLAKGRDNIMIGRIERHLEASQPLVLGDLVALHGILMTALNPKAYALMLRVREVLRRTGNIGTLGDIGEPNTSRPIDRDENNRPPPPSTDTRFYPQRNGR